MDESRSEAAFALRIQNDADLAEARSAGMSVGMLSDLLLRRFPACDAEPWDFTGMSCGDPTAPVSRVAVALDPTTEAVRQAVNAGAGVLITHHPVFLEAPKTFTPDPLRSGSGAVIYEAAQSRVALINFHTALDVSGEAQAALPAMLGLHPTGILEPSGHDRPRADADDSLANPMLPKGYGHICDVSETDNLTLGTLAARCVSVFGRYPRVWGSSDTEIGRVCTWTGSAADAAMRCAYAGVDVLVCGEIKYHAALDAVNAGVCVIELGHDVSELPLVGILAQAVIDCGVDASDVCIINQSENWFTPESRRV